MVICSNAVATLQDSPASHLLPPAPEMWSSHPQAMASSLLAHSAPTLSPWLYFCPSHCSRMQLPHPTPGPELETIRVWGIRPLRPCPLASFSPELLLALVSPGLPQPPASLSLREVPFCPLPFRSVTQSQVTNWWSIAHFVWPAILSQGFDYVLSYRN